MASKNFIKLPRSKINSPFSGKKNNGQKRRMQNIIQTIAIYSLIGLAVLILFGGFNSNSQSGNEIPLSQVISEIKEEKVEKISLEGEKIAVDYKDNSLANTQSRKEAGESIYKVLESAGVDPSKVSIEVKD